MTVLLSLPLFPTCGADVKENVTSEADMNIKNFPYTNRLISEVSPYLLQHAHNPVDWYPWGDEAFENAKSDNKLIFLSIGYSTCHWCHVMEKESFEDTEVAQLMNRAFISIKVDREERPDLDNVFMEAAMIMNRQGGWPLNLLLTPDGRPFYAATYIPRCGTAGRTGMLELIPQLETLWEERPDEVKTAADDILRALEQNNLDTENQALIETSGPLTDKIMQETFDELKSRFDSEYGGFNRRPKFPQAQNLLFLFRYQISDPSSGALEMAVKTLEQMSSGGIYDRIGFGFHRYSTDREWKLPHFEKMLYDQAMLILTYTEAWQLTGNPSFRRTAEEVISYVTGYMKSPGGGFYSTEDADWRECPVYKS